MARHWTRHIPGNPTFVPQNMPGAGTRIAANWLYSVAPKDGTAVGTVVQSTAVDQALGEPGIRFDAAQFNWLGNPIVDNLVTLSWGASGLATLDDVKTKSGLFCGSTGGGPTTVFPRVINQLIGTQIKVVTGYPGQTAVNIAMERGEVNCIGGTTWSSVKATMRPMLDGRKVNMLVQWGATKDPEISAYANRDVPLIQELGQTDLDRRVLMFIGSGAAFGRPLLAPPGIRASASPSSGRPSTAPCGTRSSWPRRRASTWTSNPPRHGAAKDRDRCRTIAARGRGAGEGIDRHDAID